MSDARMLRIAPAQRDRAYAALIAAAVDNPTVRWIFPDVDVFARVMPQFIDPVAGDTLENGTAWQVDDFSAVALLWQPGAGPDFERVSAK